MTSFALFLTLALGFLIIILPRSYAVAPMLLGSCYITVESALMIGPAHFSPMRILIVFGWIRILLKGEMENITLNDIDKAMLWLGFCIVITGIILNKNMEGFINRAGLFFNMIGLYFFFRVLILDLEDFQNIIIMLCIILIPLALLMTYEKMTQRNLFSFFGGVDELSRIRGGRLRAQGPFKHPILAGTAAATCIPMILSLWWADINAKKYVVLGVLSAFIIMITTASSGPLMAFSFVLIGIFSWPFRDNMKLVRIVIVILIIFLHLYMTAPVWFTINRISGLIGGTGWHRSMLIDQAIRHLDEWWLVGTNFTRHWMPTGVTWSSDHTDITNQYIKMGVLGGLPTMILFIFVIIRCFKAIGNGIYAERDSDFYNQFVIWCLGVTLFAHIASFISVSYFDQIIVFYYFLIACISMVSSLYEPTADQSEE